MKNLLATLFLAIAVVFSSLAQSNTGYLKSSPTHAIVDTVTNTATVNQVIQIGGYQSVVAIQPVVTKISGTAAGVVRLYGSLDGVNFVRINATDSIAVANVSTAQTKIFTVNPSNYSYYRIGYTGTGTMACKIQSLAVWRKP